MRIIMYGATHCEDTQRTRAQLQALGRVFEDINIDHDLMAEQFVIYVNHGGRSTPTVIFEATTRRKIVLVEPTDAEVEAALEAE